MPFEAGLNHLEIWVSNRKTSLSFYNALFDLIGWRRLGEGAWSSGRTEIYIREEKATSRVLSLGVHHLCFQATDRATVDQVGEWLRSINASIYQGPKEMPHYSEGYYTVDFYDPDGFILEVAHTPNMKL